MQKVWAQMEKQLNLLQNLKLPYKRAKASDKTYVIVMETHGYEWLDGTAFWESPTLMNADTENKKSALKDHVEGKANQRKGV
jgi:3D-(3,5/4)-trihydroxycyclohexane-1,2-dione acylhydrolase (decyclizing)